MAICSFLTVEKWRRLSLAIAVGLAVPGLGPLAHGAAARMAQAREEVRASYCDHPNVRALLDHEVWANDAGNEEVVNYRMSRTGLTYLHLVSWCNADSELIVVLLTHGHRAGARNADGQTPLHLAAEGNSHSGVITALVESGSDIEAADDAGDTPLLRAAQFNSNPAVLDALVAAGTDIEVRDAEGDTPLIVAARHNSPTVVHALLAAGADIHADRRPAPPPQVGTARFIESRPVSAGITALHAAARSNEDAAVIRVLVEAGANVEAETGLPIGSRLPHHRFPVTCSRRGVPPLDPPIGPSRGGERPIHFAARSNSNPAVIEALLEAGAEMRAQACSGNTALDLIHAYNRAVRDSDVYWILREASYNN